MAMIHSLWKDYHANNKFPPDGQKTGVAGIITYNPEADARR